MGVMIKPGVLASRIATGTYGKLDYDFTCQNGRSFDEAWLHNTILNITQAQYNSQEIKVEKNHPISSISRPGPRGAGRPRQVDIAAREMNTRPPSDSGVVTCLEAKWAVGTSKYGVDSKNILTDLIRLSIIANSNPDVACLFVLAGGKNHVEKAVNNCSMVAPNGERVRFLSSPGAGVKTKKYRLSNAPGRPTQVPEEIQKKLRKDYTQVPPILRTASYVTTHAEHPNWRVHVWRVLAE